MTVRIPELVCRLSIVLCVLDVGSGCYFHGGEDGEAPPLRDSLIGEWLFSDASDLTMLDTSDNDNVGTAFGPTAVADRFGNPASAYLYDGIDDYAVIQDEGGALNFDLHTESYSVSLWVMMTELPDRHATALIDRALETDEPTSFTFEYRPDFCEPRCFDVTVWDGAMGIQVPSETVPQTDTWYHLTAVADTTEISLYVNGVREKGPALGGESNDVIPGEFGTSVNGHRSLSVGRNAPYYNYQFPGTIDDIRIYDRALSESEIQALFHERGWGE